MKSTLLLSAIAAMTASASSAAQGVDPASAEIRSEDAHRFVAVFEAATGAPTAEQLQTGYLDNAGRGVEVFTPYRIRNAENLAAAINANPQAWRRAIDVCLPIAESMTGELRDIYAGMQALLPGQDLPEIHIVFGAGSSGGTAGPGVQVLGLEVICAMNETEEEIRQTFRRFFAHETVHTFQSPPSGERVLNDPLLFMALIEGTADYIAERVTGETPEPARDAWARENADMVWQRFAADRVTIRDGFFETETNFDMTPEANAARRYWWANYGQAPDGWPYEMAYWVGHRIAEGYVANADDPGQAVRDLVALEDPAAILAASGLEDRATLD